MYNKVELCGMDTAQLPVLTEAQKRELLTRAHAGDAAARQQMIGWFSAWCSGSPSGARISTICFR